eukprot:4773389-Amphidinium_carterae.1
MNKSLLKGVERVAVGRDGSNEGMEATKRDTKEAYCVDELTPARLKAENRKFTNRLGGLQVEVSLQIFR